MRQTQVKMDIKTMPQQIVRDENCPRLKYRDKSSSKAPVLRIVSRENHSSSIVFSARGLSDW